MKKGSLIVVGSGIKSVAQFTLESRAWIQECDVVLYCVADPASEIWIRNNSKSSIDLYKFYGNDKRRLDTYNDMVDATLDFVRAGKDTCMVFYGHPGVFVYPSHKAIEIARSEGHRAAMLPAISALDCLWADLGVDPSRSGSQTIEATDLLLRQRPLLTDSHVVVWQIGCVGDLGFNFGGYDLRKFDVLVDYLLEFYSKEHEVVHYQASQYPVCPQVMERMPLGDLYKANVTGISTLYIPPLTERETKPEILQALGLKFSNKSMPKSKGKEKRAYRKVPDSLAERRKKSCYIPTAEKSGLADLIAAMAESPNLLAEYKRNPEWVADAMAELTAKEREALLSGHSGKIRMSIKTANDEALAGINAARELAAIKIQEQSC